MDNSHNSVAGAFLMDMESNAAKRTRTDPGTPKVRVVPGPQGAQLDDALQDSAFYKEQSAAAKRQARVLTQENQHLRTSLAAAESAASQHTADIQSMQQRLEEYHNSFRELQSHEGQMEAQFLGDQEQLKQMRQEFGDLYSKLVESQQFLMQRNEDVERLQRAITQKTDEAIQLRASAQTQAEKTPQRKFPRRSTRASFSPAQNVGKPPLEIPLDPAPVASLPPCDNNTGEKSLNQQTVADFLHADLETFTEILSKLKSLKINDAGVTVHMTKSKRSTRKKKTEISKELVNDINSALRVVTYEQFKVKQAGDFAHTQFHTPATQAEVDACEDGVGDPAPNVFKWDFGAGYTKSRWNELMMQKIVDLVMEDYRDFLEEHNVERELLEMKLGEQLVRYRSAWNNFQPRLVEDEDRMETKREAAARALAKIEQNQLNSRQTSSKIRKFAQRVETVEETIALKKEKGIVADIKTWERLLEMILILGEQGMSSEEEDEVEVDNEMVTIYRVKICIWREPRVVDYLRWVDKQTKESRAKLNIAGRKPSTRYRNSANGFGVSKAPRGLPESLYNNAWLKEASPAYLRELKVSKEAFGLFVAATERMAK
ncbi:hypothetical protein FB45DRAFT_1035806 [Roridomyces roridus]|uniref:Uncharacterized protein n=1 Tax=Roridomyces roridus TaxID=1738132 RepID=A0AAD7BAG0_9AGAR|nr:hypothetical protein FB45DRAFT_1035806 [Roridomyces roridus]